MKKSALSLLATITLSATSYAYASLPLVNASGHILPSSPNSPINTGNSLPVSVSLNNLMPNALHNIICKVNIENYENNSPVYVRFDITGLDGLAQVNNIEIDEIPLFSHQYRFKDNNNHTVTFSNIATRGANAAIQMTRLDGWMIPFDYECRAEYVEGFR